MYSAPSLLLTSLSFTLFSGSIARAQCQFEFRGGFPYAGASGAPLASALFDDGTGSKLYLAGPRFVGQIQVDGFFSFDGSTWAPVGGGVEGTIHAMTVHDGAIYVCGDIRSVGAMPVNCVARWDGASWAPLGSGLPNSNTWTIAAYHNEIYVGRWGSPPVLARWDGAAWNAVESLDANDVLALGVYNDRLYASGGIRIGGEWENIAAWDGVTWSSVAGGFDQQGHAHTLVEIDGSLYAGGSMLRAGTVDVNRVARWDGQNWHAAGDGLLGEVYALHRFQGALYAGGPLGTSSEPRGEHLAWLEGETWRSIHVEGQNLWTLSTLGQRMYAGGAFSVIGGLTASNLAAFDGEHWSRINSGIVGSVSDLAQFNNDLFAGGSIRLLGDLPVGGVARFDGAEWHDASAGLESGFNKFVELAGVLHAIVGPAAGSTSQLIRWNGTSWESLPYDFNGLVHDLVEYNGEWIATGTFTNIDGVPCRRISRFDGVAWQPLGSGLGQNDSSSDHGNALAVYEGRLIVGGVFTRAGGITVSNLAVWDGGAWSALGPALSHTSTGVRTLLARGSSLYVGGSFANAGGIPINNLARWDGVRWNSVGGGTPGVVIRLNSLGQSLIVSGSFVSIGGIPALGFARWDGAAWHGFDGSGLQSGVSAIEAYAGRLYLGTGRVESDAGISVALASAAIPSLTADLDHDGDTDLQDLATLLSGFGADDGPGDLDGDHDTDLQDLSILLTDFGTICP